MAQDYTATNPKTGETVRWNGMAWEPIPKPNKFESDVVSGIGLDSNKIASSGSAGSQWREVGKEISGGVGNWLKKTAMDPFHITDPIETMANNLESALKERNPGKIIGALSSISGGMEAPEMGEVPGKVVGGIKTAGKEIAGHGPSMDRLHAMQDMTGLKIKNEYLAPLEKAVHDDAQANIQHAIKGMEEKFPGGVVSKEDLASKLDSIFKDMVKNPEKLPTPVQELLERPKAKGLRAWTSSEQKASLQAAQMLKRGASPGDVKDTLVALQYTPKEIEGIMDSIQKPAEESLPSYSPTKLQQLRSQVRDYAYGSKGRSLSGPVKIATQQAYEHLSELLDDAATKSNRGPSWNVGNSKWKTYKETFDGKYDKGEFHESPLSKAISGQTADEIVKPLTEGNAQWTRDLLTRYSKFGPKIQEMMQNIRKYQWIDTLEKVSHPSKYEMAATPMAAIDPTFFAKLAATRLLTPPVIRWLVTHGINPENVRGYETVQPGIPGGK